VAISPNTLGQWVLSFVPELVRSARADRRFLLRAVQYLAGKQGIRQFLDIGTGLPTADNTYQVAQQVAVESRIVYADNDPFYTVADTAGNGGSTVCAYIRRQPPRSGGNTGAAFRPAAPGTPHTKRA
jgi:hypothetical protein